MSYNYSRNVPFFVGADFYFLMLTRSRFSTQQLYTHPFELRDSSAHSGKGYQEQFTIELSCCLCWYKYWRCISTTSSLGNLNPFFFIRASTPSVLQNYSKRIYFPQNVKDTILVFCWWLPAHFSGFHITLNIIAIPFSTHCSHY